MLATLSSTADVLYNIDFSQFSPGDSYTNAGGPPNDFDAASVGQHTTAFISTAYLGLNDQPLVTATTNIFSDLAMRMNVADTSNQLWTLSLQLALGSDGLDVGPSAEITIQSDLDGENRTQLWIAFGRDINGGHDPTNIQVISRSGIFYLPSIIWDESLSLTRDEPLDVLITINTLDNVFGLSIDSMLIAESAPLGDLPISTISIAMGSTVPGADGSSAIDNILLTSEVIPEPSSLLLMAAGLFGLVAFRNNSIGRRFQPGGGAYR